MAFPMTQIPLTANGNIRPGRFLTTVSGNSNFLLVVEATASTQILLGISERYVRGPADGQGGSNELYIAITGDEVPYRGPLQIAELLLGGTVSNMGVLLTSDGSGQGVATAPANGTTTYYGAIALQAGVSGDYIPVYVLPPTPTV
jgi:hypothetical protein